MNQNQTDLEILRENYVRHVLDGMDWDTLYTFAFDTIHDSIGNWSENELKEQILNLYDEETLQELSSDSFTRVTYSDTLKPAS